MAPEMTPFNYYVYLASEVLILRLDGVLGRDSRKKLKKISEEIKELSYTHLVLNLEKITQVEALTHRFLVQTQQEVKKEKQGSVRIITPPPLVKEKLIREGILKKEEVFDDLKQARESI